LRKATLITGITGFIGSNLARRLIAEGWEVHGLVRSDSRFNLIWDLKDNIQLHVMDGKTETLLRIIAQSKVESVFHLASLFLATHTSKDVLPLIQSNVGFGAQLLEAMAVNGVHKMVNAGTAWQNFNSEPYNPICLYAATKQAFQDVARFYSETTPIKILHLKFHDTYGPGDPRKKLFYVLRQAVRESKVLEMSPGDQYCDLVYIDDAVRALIHAEGLLSPQGPSEQVYSASSGNPIQLKAVVRAYESVIGRELSILWGRRPYRPRETMSPTVSAPTLPGWSPKVQLADGLGQMERSGGGLLEPTTPEVLT
jgi:nucleoside-diphosphate-sugar epimerase